MIAPRKVECEARKKENHVAYLKENELEGTYETINMPCDFLQEDGECILGECKPENCKKYPYTNQPERLENLLGLLDVIEVCPVALEIFERLKESSFDSGHPKNIQNYSKPPRMRKLRIILGGFLVYIF